MSTCSHLCRQLPPPVAWPIPCLCPLSQPEGLENGPTARFGPPYQTGSSTFPPSMLGSSVRGEEGHDLSIKEAATLVHMAHSPPPTLLHPAAAPLCQSRRGLLETSCSSKAIEMQSGAPLWWLIARQWELLVNIWLQQKYNRGADE